MALQLLISLKFLKSNNIIHCDLKPENVLLKYYNKSMIKIVDFGSSCYQNQRIYTYIQSRFYRAPEVVLGLPYGFEIDMWSVGCIVFELINGLPLFPGESETDQIGRFTEVLGAPPEDILKQASRALVFYEPDLITPKYDVLKYQAPGHRKLKEVLNTEDDLLVDFLTQCF